MDSSRLKTHHDLLGAAVILLAAVISHLHAFESWWCLDDWGQLAGAAGTGPAPTPGLQARWLSQTAWWQLTWPLFGLKAAAHTTCRVVLHGLASLLVLRIGRAVGLKPTAALLGALLFAVSPFSFTPVFWASGIQELLGATFALLAIDRWLAPSGRTAILWSAVFALGSFLAKESGLGLPLLLAVMVGLHIGSSRSHLRDRWAAVAVMAVAALGEGLLVTRHFAHATGDPYAVGGALTLLTNLAKYGWWLATFNPHFTSQMTPVYSRFGLLLFLVWILAGAVAYRRDLRFPLVALLWALLSLAPALTLVKQSHPYLAYLAAAGFYLALAHLVPARLPARRWVLPAVIPVVLAWGTLGMQGRWAAEVAPGVPADPVVRAVQMSRQSADVLLQPGLHRQGTVTAVHVFQPPISAADVANADRLGPGHVLRSPRYAALEVPFGPELILGPGMSVDWRNSLFDIQPDAAVFCEVGNGMMYWGSAWDGMLNAAVVDMALGHHDRARRHLLGAVAIDPELQRFQFRPAVNPVSRPQFLSGAAGFQQWLGNLPATGAAAARDKAELRKAFNAFTDRIVY